MLALNLQTQAVKQLGNKVAGGATVTQRHEDTDDKLFAAQAMIDDGKLELLQEMYASWPFFSVTLDMVEMVRPLPSAAQP